MIIKIICTVAMFGLGTLFALALCRAAGRDKDEYEQYE